MCVAPRLFTTVASVLILPSEIRSKLSTAQRAAEAKAIVLSGSNRVGYKKRIVLAQYAEL